MPDCLANIVGITQRDCDCLDAFPDEWEAVNASGTGYFLTDEDFGFANLQAVDASGDCGAGSIWDILVRAREQAVRQFRLDLSATMAKEFRHTSGFTGTVGMLNKIGALQQERTYTGTVIQPKRTRDGYFTVTEVHTAQNTTGTGTLTIVSNDPYFAPVTISGIVFGSPGRTVLAEAVRLPMWSEYVKNLTYWFTIEQAPGARVKSITNFCCGNRPLWTQYFHTARYTKDVPPDMTKTPLLTGCSSFSDGLALTLHLDCNETEWLCRMQEISGYSAYHAAGRAIQAAAAAGAIATVLQSNQINRYTLQPPDALNSVYKHRTEVYETNMRWLASNMPNDATGCLECADKVSFRAQTILV